jgi:hypothetical protein
MLLHLVADPAIKSFVVTVATVYLMMAGSSLSAMTQVLFRTTLTFVR